jgi:hypothetical protein
MPTPEEQARQKIDQLLDAAGWQVQDRSALNLGAARGVTAREFPLETGFANYMLFVDRKAVGVIEAKPEGTTLLRSISTVSVIDSSNSLPPSQPTSRRRYSKLTQRTWILRLVGLKGKT